MPDFSLLLTKICLPESRPEWVIHTRLFVRLERASCVKLTPLAAPPGYGKTALLINELRLLPGEQLLVLGDYQAINQFSIHNSLSFMLDYLPANVHLLCLTRSTRLC